MGLDKITLVRHDAHALITHIACDEAQVADRIVNFASTDNDCTGALQRVTNVDNYFRKDM